MNTQKRLLILRIISDVCIILLILTTPWWIVIPVTLISLFLFRNYYELIFFGFLFDTLYSPQTGMLKYFGTMLGFAFLCIELAVKERMRI